MAFISIQDNDNIKVFELPEDRTFVFGRGEHVDFQIQEDSLISREHFEIDKDEKGEFIVIDLGASNGTFLNNRRLEGNSIRTLKDGDKITAGRMIFSFHVNRPVIQRKRDPLAQVSDALKKGKGYKTILSELVAKSPRKK